MSEIAYGPMTAQETANESARIALDIVNAVSLPRDTPGFAIAARHAQIAREIAQEIGQKRMHASAALVAMRASAAVAEFHSALHAG